jgi:hypothetical protein
MSLASGRVPVGEGADGQAGRPGPAAVAIVRADVQSCVAETCGPIMIFAS